MKTLALVLALAFAAPLAAHADTASAHGLNGSPFNVPNVPAASVGG